MFEMTNTMKVINVFCIYLGVLIYQAPVMMGAASDCWNPDRLAQMKFDLSPGKFSVTTK